MLQDIDKTSTLWKHYKGFGSTHTKRETFEELYHSFKSISTNSVLTYGDLLPTKKTDKFYEDVAKLDSTNNTFFYDESSFKNLPILRKVIDLKLTPISGNCEHAFAILDDEGKQYKNIVPFDFSDTGLYDYTLKKENGDVIPFGVCDWIVDTNSALLTFNNGIPEGVDSANPPTLTFFQYIGPVGERHYIDAVAMDIQKVSFEKGDPTKVITEIVRDKLDEIETGFFEKNKFNGTDITEGVGLQYNVLFNATDSSTGDPLKGFDDNSNSQVTYLLSHKKGESSDLEVLFVSETIEAGSTLKIQVDNKFEGETGSPFNDISKINTETGFVVVKGKTGTHTIQVQNSSDVTAVLLVKDNVTQDLELYYPREVKTVNLKIPVFVDMIKLPPHLKLESLNSYSDHITPQYYGPRMADFVVAADGTSVNYRSADYVVYNKERSWLSDAIDARAGDHLFLRSGVYENNNLEYTFPESVLLEGESRRQTVIKNAKFYLTKDSCIEKLTFIDSEIVVLDFVAIKTCDFHNTKVYIRNGQISALILASTFEDLEVDGNEILESSNVVNLKVNDGGSVNALNSNITGKLLCNGTSLLYGSFVNEFLCEGGKFLIGGSNINILNAPNVDKESILDTTSIRYVEALPEYIKINTSYVTEFSPAIRRPVYPDETTIPYYVSFKQRVYAKTPKPFYYDEKTNSITLLLDTIEDTIFINKNGELQCRFFSAEEISLVDPEAIKTQIEEVYNEHGDTVLGTERPKTVEEAIVDLYWAKADLKNGKVPIDQLPDSVAYGGLTLVGMWSFEDSNGEYPTFKDVDESFSSDDEYTDLQNGWFFIVDASHKEDDPVAPQYSNDGVEWTAGDWIIFTGGHNRKIDFTKPTAFLAGDCEITSDGDGVFTVINNKPVKKVYTADPISDDSTDDSGDDSYEDSNDSSSDSREETKVYPNELGTFKINSENVITEINGDYLEELLGIEIGQLFTDNKKFKVKKVSYIQTNGKSNPWHKLDRAYLDPVYSRLPQYAVVSGGENPEWSIDDGGTGLLRLSYLSLAEAIRLINEALLKLSPDHPNSLRTIKVVLDEEKTTAKKVDYIPIGEGELQDYLKEEVESVWDSNSGRVYFKQEGIHDQLPLEHCFYCGKESEINIFDNERDITENCKIERFDPYAKYRLGFRAPTVMDGAEITGFVQLGEYGYQKDHVVKYSQYNLQRASHVTEPAEEFEGDSKPLEFSERKFYKMQDMKVNWCDEADTNISTLNQMLSKNKTGGYSFIPKGTKLSSAFLIEDFIKYGTVDPNVEVALQVLYGEEELDFEIYSEMLTLTDASNESYDLKVRFVATLDTLENIKTDNVQVKVKIKNFDFESNWNLVMSLDDIRLMDPTTIPAVVEPGQLIWPELGNDKKINFGSDYINKDPVVYPELMWENNENPGFGWPELNKYLNRLVVINPLDKHLVYDQYNKEASFEIDKVKYRVIAFKKEFESVYDLCGFFVNLDWVVPPKINNEDGTMEGVLLQVCVTSAEEKHTLLLDGNKPINSAFFELDYDSGVACNYPGKSDANRRRISFGRKSLAVSEIYIRIGIAEKSGLRIRGISIDTDHD